MTRDEKLLFSWRVLQCYYQDAGRILPECQSDSIRVCIQTLPSSDFNIYTQFYNHADSMCFYRESKEWQERTDRSIQHLEMAAEKASQLLFSPYILLYIQRYLHFQGREAAFDAAGAHASLHGFAPAESRRIRNRIADRREILGSSRSLSLFPLEPQSSLHSSLDQLRNASESYYDSTRNAFYWTRDKLDSIAGLQDRLRSSLSDVAALFRLTGRVLAAYYLTAVPGVRLAG